MRLMIDECVYLCMFVCRMMMVRDELMDGWNIVSDFYLLIPAAGYMCISCMSSCLVCWFVSVAEMWYKMAFS